MKHPLLILTVLLAGMMVCSQFCSAWITYESNASRGIPSELVEKNKAIQEKYKEIAESGLPQFIKPTNPFPLPSTTVPTVVVTSAIPTDYPTPVPTTASPEPTTNVTPIASGDQEEPATTAAFFSAVLVLVLATISAILNLAVRWRDREPPGLAAPWWSRWHGVIAGVHALMAVIFFLEGLVFIDSGMLWFLSSGREIAWIILGGFLLVNGAVSSAGLAISSFFRRERRNVSIVHAALLAAGLAVYAVFLFAPVFPFLQAVPVAAFLGGLGIILIQANVPRETAAEPPSAYTDTMLFEDNPAAATPSFPPELSGRYFDARFLHQGGIARVFSARRRSDGTMVAVKVPIHTDEQTGRSLLREMSVWKTLIHPGIVQVNAANILPVPFVEMEYLPGSLEDIPLPMEPGDAAALVRKVAEALLFAHSGGVIHRDLKPGNILLTARGEPKIGDWGLSRNDGIPSETTLHGFSLSYAAPEQLDPGRFGRSTGKTDIYQIGIIFYQLLTGTLPFPGESIAEVTTERLSGISKPFFGNNPSLSMFGPVIGRCLETSPDERYSSLKDLLSDLEAAERKYRALAGKSPGHEEEDFGSG